MQELYFLADIQVLRKRLQELGEWMAEHRLDLICISDPALRRYLVDEEAEGNGSAFLIVDRSGKLTQISGRGKGISHAAGLDVEAVVFVDYDIGEWAFPKEKALQELSKVLHTRKPRRIGFDFHLSAVSDEIIKDFHALELQDIRPYLIKQRVVKAPYEIERIRRVGQINKAAYEAIRKHAAEQVSEMELFALMTEETIRTTGYPVNFVGRSDLISGVRSMNAGGPPTGRKLQAGDTIIVDLFPTVHGYHADNCRTFVVGEPSKLQLRLYETVMTALKKAETLLLPGNRVKDIFREVNEVLQGIGNDYSLWHHLGHGVGVYDQEAPYLIPGSDEVLEEGSVISIEPAIYVEGHGVRIENVYHIRKDGPENLTPFPTEL